MDIRDIAENEDIAMVMNLRGYKPFISFLKIINTHIEKETERILDKPIIDNADLKKDLRFKMGRVSGLKDVLDIIKQCEELYHE